VRPDGFVYDLVAIGAGAGGLVSAKQSARRGAKSALIERHLAGGDCLNSGCVPSKALIRCSRAVAEAKRLDLGFTNSNAVDFAKVMERMRRLRAEIATVDSHVTTVKAGVDMYVGDATFTGEHEVSVGGQLLKFKKCVIAVGGRAAVPPISGLKEVPYLTNASLFNLTALPPRLVILGAGPIGCEMAQAFARFGSKVTLIDLMPQPIPAEDPDAIQIIRSALNEDGVHFMLGANTESVAFTQEEGAPWPEITLQVAQENVPTQAVLCDALLVATGRAPNVEGLGLEAANVQLNRFGIIIDDDLRTSNLDILAVGDCCARPELRFTHMSGAMAGMAVQQALFDTEIPPVNAPCCKLSEVVVPRCTYTEPEVASAGFNAASAEKKGVDVDVYTASLAHNDRCILEGARDAGFVRMFCRKGTEELVGAVVVAEHAGDILGELMLAIQNKIGISKIGRTIHAYPTVAEGVQQCALNFNRATWRCL